MSFAEKLDYLMRRSSKPDGKPYTYAEIVEASGGRLTISHLSQMRRGGRDNPTYEVIQALADVFGVDPQFFFDSPDEMPLPPLPNSSKEKETFDDDVIEIALRAGKLDNDGQAVVRSILEHLQKQLPKKKRPQ